MVGEDVFQIKGLLFAFLEAPPPSECSRNPLSGGIGQGWDLRRNRCGSTVDRSKVLVVDAVINLILGVLLVVFPGGGPVIRSTLGAPLVLSKRPWRRAHRNGTGPAH